MDKEGLDLAILFPTSAMYVTAFTRMDPRFAAAACRAYNDWLHDYIQAADPKRMFGAAAVSPHDVESAVAETRRAVGELGMKAIFLRPEHLQRPAVARPLLRSALGGLPGAERPGRLPRDHRLADEGRRHRPLQDHGHRPHLDPLDGADAGLHGRHHGRRHGALPAAALRLSRGAVRLAAVLARPHGRALRMARAVWRDDPSVDAAVGIFPAARVLRGRVRRGIRQPCRRGVRRRQPRHHDRLPARRFEIPEGDGPLPGAAAERPQQAEDPVGQRAAASTRCRPDDEDRVHRDRQYRRADRRAVAEGRPRARRS